jgi:pyruvate/2-oxoglutarate dehydrogenase complex dihydrolipoamide acyltransferase (E2) component
MTRDRDGYTVVPFPAVRHVYLDTLHLAYRKHDIHALLELDVTRPRRLIREHKARTGEALSFTAFVLACLGRAVDAHKTVHAYRAGRNRLVLFDEVDVTTMVEIPMGDQRTPLAHVVRATNRRSVHDIHTEIRTLQAERNRERTVPSARLVGLYPWVPACLRRLVWKAILKNPHRMKARIGTVLLSSVGMFGQGGGWGVAVPLYTLGVLLGGISEKPVVVDGRIEVRELLSVTLSFDHDIVDGAPAARFAQHFRELIEGGYGLVGPDPSAT